MTQIERDAMIASLDDEFRRRGFGGFIQILERIKTRGSAFVSTARSAAQAQDDFDREVDRPQLHSYRCSDRLSYAHQQPWE